jgi:hypothetical protein
LKKGGKSRSEYEKASLERIQAEIVIYFMPKPPLFQPISFECHLQIKREEDGTRLNSSISSYQKQDNVFIKGYVVKAPVKTGYFDKPSTGTSTSSA